MRGAAWLVVLLFLPLATSSGALPTFATSTVANSNIVFGAGEPSLSVAPSGDLWLSFPGCEASTLNVVLGNSCTHGPVYRSANAGSSWARQNAVVGGRLASGAPSANGDADVAVDAAGNAYAADLGSNTIQFMRLVVGQPAWQYLQNVVPSGAWSDRQWIAGAEANHVVVGWMGGANTSQRAYALRASFDGGVTFSPTRYVGSGIGWVGPIAFASDNLTAFAVYSQPAGGGSGGLVARSFALWLARSIDGGVTWSTSDTGFRVPVPYGEDQWSGVLMAPALAITGTGRVVIGWSEYAQDLSRSAATGAVVKIASSTNGGASWAPATALNAVATVGSPESAIMPWIAVGRSDRVGVSYFASPLPLDPNRVGDWSVMASFLDLSAPTPTPTSVVVEDHVHEGGICAQGGACLILGEDRALLDFFKSTAMPDGRMVIAFPADPATNGLANEIRFAIQTGGDSL